ncbi:MAG TPA: type ISP restriction/modification enzyme [Candidatus Angelobacter sp.]|jgi:predicted helicase
MELSLKPSHAKVKDYYKALNQFGQLNISHETANRRENITDWALDQFRSHYKDKCITKWDIFYYTYAVLHHPEYRTRYAANLKRELPRIPYAPDFHPFAKAGKRLAELHVDYEKQKEYPLERREKPGEKLNLRVEKMRLSKDKQTLLYNDFLTLTGIPKETYDYRLGNRSALEWVIDQYQVSTDKRSGIANDPNREDDKEYILRLIGQVITVSLETVKIVNALPDLGLPKETAAKATTAKATTAKATTTIQ